MHLVGYSVKTYIHEKWTDKKSIINVNDKTVLVMPIFELMERDEKE